MSLHTIIGTILLIVASSPATLSFISLPPMSQILPSALSNTISSVASSSSCNCPCRTNHVTRCIQTYHSKCDPPPSYETTQQKCSQYPVIQTRNVTETECQVCRHV